MSQEVESLKKQAALKLGAETAALIARKRKSVDHSLSAAKPPPAHAALPSNPSPPKKRRKSEKGGEGGGDGKWKKDRLYCICKTPYDETK